MCVCAHTCLCFYFWIYYILDHTTIISFFPPPPEISVPTWTSLETTPCKTSLTHQPLSQKEKKRGEHTVSALEVAVFIQDVGAAQLYVLNALGIMATHSVQTSHSSCVQRLRTSGDSYMRNTCVRVHSPTCVCSAFCCCFVFIILYVDCFGRTMLCMCIEYCI